MNTVTAVDDPLAGAMARCRYGEISVGFVYVDVEMAAHWLTLNVRNRNLRPRLVHQYGRDMTEGRWHFDGAPVRFDSNGSLIDGQHRLSAILRSGEGQLLIVITGLPTEAQVVTDTGGKRGASDMHKLDGREHGSTLAAVTRIAVAWNRGLITTSGSDPGETVSNIHQREVVAADPNLTWAVEMAVKYRRAKFMTPATLGLFFWLLADIDREGAVEYIDAIANYATAGEGDPRLAVLRRLSTARVDDDVQARSKKLGAVAATFVLVRGWNAWVAGNQLAFIRISANGKPLAFPRIERRPAI